MVLSHLWHLLLAPGWLLRKNYFHSWHDHRGQARIQVAGSSSKGQRKDELSESYIYRVTVTSTASQTTCQSLTVSNCPCLVLAYDTFSPLCDIKPCNPASYPDCLDARVWDQWNAGMPLYHERGELSWHTVLFASSWQLVIATLATLKLVLSCRREQ